MKNKNPRGHRITRLGTIEYVPRPDLEGVPKLTPPSPDKEERIAAVKERKSRPRPEVTSWLDEQGSLVVHDAIAGTKTLTRQCPECLRWFQIVRESKGRARWPKTCSEACRASNRRKVDAERKRRERARAKMPQKYKFDTIDCDLYYQSLPRLLACTNAFEKDGVVHRTLSPTARAQAEAYLREQEEWESWAQH